MFWNILLAFALAAGVVLLIWYVRGVMLTPVRRGKGQRMRIALEISGPAPELESTVDGLLWLIANGTLWGEIEIIDRGMEPSALQAAELLARHSGRVTVIREETEEAEHG